MMMNTLNSIQEEFAVKFTTFLKTEPEQLVQTSTTKLITESNSDPIHDEALYHYVIA
jgi:hypothetical protein